MSTEQNTRGPWYPLHAGLVRIFVGVLLVTCFVVWRMPYVFDSAAVVWKTMREKGAGLQRDWGTWISALWSGITTCDGVAVVLELMIAVVGVWLIVGRGPGLVRRLIGLST